jgi:hypothetical protein
VRFNPEINLGTIVEIAVFVLAVFGAIRKLGVLEAKLNIMYGWFEKSVMNRSNDERFFGKGD